MMGGRKLLTGVDGVVVDDFSSLWHHWKVVLKALSLILFMAYD
jgi:hypothetical protein